MDSTTMAYTFNILKECADMGDPRACRRISEYYYFGNYVEHDTTRSQSYFYKSCCPFNGSMTQEDSIRAKEKWALYYKRLTKCFWNFKSEILINRYTVFLCSASHPATLLPMADFMVKDALPEKGERKHYNRIFAPISQNPIQIIAKFPNLRYPCVWKTRWLSWASTKFLFLQPAFNFSDSGFPWHGKLPFVICNNTRELHS